MIETPLRQKVRGGVESLFNMVGFEIYIRRKAPQFDRALIDKKMFQRYVQNDAFMKLYAEGMKRTGMQWADNFPKQCRFYSLLQMVRHVLDKKVPGHFAECGCWKGHSTYMISKLLKDAGFKNEFHVFDSFEGGLSDKKEEDKTALSAEEVQKEKIQFASTEDEVRHAVKEFPFVKLYKGWIPDRFPEVADKTFAFANIDVDLYQPTLDSLEFFYPRLSPGGCIVIDDYGYAQFPGCQKAVTDFLKKNTPSFHHAGHLGAFFLIK